MRKMICTNVYEKKIDEKDKMDKFIPEKGNEK